MNRKRTDNHIESSPHIREHLPELTTEELDFLSAHKDSIEDCRNVLDSRLVMLQEQCPDMVDTEKAWQLFKQKHTVSHRRKRLIRLLAVGGIAASLLFGLYRWQTLNEHETENISVYMADKQPQHIMLQVSDEAPIVVDKDIEQRMKAVGVDARIDTDIQLTYNSAVPAAAMQTHTLTTPKGQTCKITLSDSTEIWLNESSRLEYPASFTEDERTVSLQGEAYFQVTHDAEKPFIIVADGIRARVLGTELNVKHYADEDAHVTLIDGSVEVSNSGATPQTIRLTPQQNVDCLRTGGFLVRQVDVDPYRYWKNGYFYFDDIPLIDVAKTLGRWYNVDVVFRNRNIMNYRLRFISERQAGLSAAVSLLNELKKFVVVQEDNTLYLDALPKN